MPLPLLLLVVFCLIGGIGYVLMRGTSGEAALVTQRLENFAEGVDSTAVMPSPFAPARHTSKRKQDLFTEMDRAFEQKDFYSRMILEFQKADLAIRYTEYAAFFAGVVLVFGGLTWAISANPVLASMAAIIGGFIPRFYVRFRQMMRVRYIDQQLVDALILISNSLKSGYSFLQGMELVGEEAPEPICVEFRRMLREINLGLPVEDALDHCAERVPSEDLDLVITSVKIQRTVGGNLAEVLDKIIHTIRERIRIKGEINTLTAQGKLQGIILTLLPPAMMFGISMIAPDFMRPLYTTLAGKLMLGWAFIQQGVGAFMIFKIVNIKV